jgi:hypothetical protein
MSFGIGKKNITSHPVECATYLEDGISFGGYFKHTSFFPLFAAAEGRASTFRQLQLMMQVPVFIPGQYSAVHDFWPVRLSKGRLGVSYFVFGLVSSLRLPKYRCPCHTEHDFRLPPRSRCELRTSGLLCSEQW